MYALTFQMLCRNLNNNYVHNHVSLAWIKCHMQIGVLNCQLLNPFFFPLLSQSINFHIGRERYRGVIKSGY